MARGERWTIEKIPMMEGKVAVVTGANSGLGFQTALALAARGASVVMGCRDEARGRAACHRIGEAVPNAKVTLLPLDLADLRSVQRFAEQCAARYPRLALLINNAGVMALPYRRTADGFESQFGTNHLGHFALTGRLLPLLQAEGQARVVTVSSILHRRGKIAFDDLQGERGYRPWVAYSQSKLANLLFGLELHRRMVGKAIVSVVAHPGYAATNLAAAGPRLSGSRARETLVGIANRWIAQTDAQGALPQLYAATAPEIQGGEFIGPDGFRELWGYPTKVQGIAHAYDPGIARHLWEVSETLTSVRFPTL